MITGSPSNAQVNMEGFPHEWRGATLQLETGTGGHYLKSLVHLSEPCSQATAHQLESRHTCSLKVRYPQMPSVRRAGDEERPLLSLTLQRRGVTCTRMRHLALANQLPDNQTAQRIMRIRLPTQDSELNQRLKDHQFSVLSEQLRPCLTRGIMASLDKSVRKRPEFKDLCENAYPEQQAAGKYAQFEHVMNELTSALSRAPKLDDSAWDKALTMTRDICKEQLLLQPQFGKDRESEIRTELVHVDESVPGWGTEPFRSSLFLSRR